MIQLSTKDLETLTKAGLSLVNTGKKRALTNPSPSRGHSLGYVTDMETGYERSWDLEYNSEEEVFSYYMTRQEKNMAKVKQKTGIRLRVKPVRKPSGT